MCCKLLNKILHVVTVMYVDLNMNMNPLNFAKKYPSVYGGWAPPKDCEGGGSSPPVCLATNAHHPMLAHASPTHQQWARAALGKSIIFPKCSHCGLAPLHNFTNSRTVKVQLERRGCPNSHIWYYLQGRLSYLIWRDPLQGIKITIEPLQSAFSPS